MKIKSKLFQIKKKILRVLEGANTNCFLGKMMVFRSVIKVYKKLEKKQVIIMMGLTHAALINSTLSGEMLKKTKKI